MLFLSLSILAACGGGAGDTDTLLVDTSKEDTGIPWPDSPCEGLTDEDADGWCLESGDCDDTNPLVNPGRDEDETDGLDNDCDGRLDEKFAGLVVIQVGDYETIPHRIVGVDALGKESFSVDLDSMELAPYFLTAGVNGGWVVLDLAELQLYNVSETGHVEQLADLSESEFGAYGLTTHPNGFYIVGQGNGVLAVDPETGIMSPMAMWDIEVDGLYAFDMAVNHSNGEVGVFGLYGAFAIVTEAGEFDMIRKTDFEAESAGDYLIYSGDYQDQVGWFASGWDADGFAIFSLDKPEGLWNRQLSWADDWDPHFVAVDSDSGDFYLTTEGGQYPYIWRLKADGSDASTFFPDLGTITPGISYWDLYAVY